MLKRSLVEKPLPELLISEWSSILYIVLSEYNTLVLSSNPNR